MGFLDSIKSLFGGKPAQDEAETPNQEEMAGEASAPEMAQPEATTEEMTEEAPVSEENSEEEKM